MSHHAPQKQPVGIWRAFLAVVAGVLTLAAASAGPLWQTHHHTGQTATTAQADVLRRSEPVGNLRLLAFLDTQPDTGAGASRSQAIEINSLINQYGDKGLAAEIVDESGAARSALINTYYDWHLGDIRLKADPGQALAARYGVDHAPTTLLLDHAGRVVARWNSYALPSEAAQTISDKLA